MLFLRSFNKVYKIYSKASLRKTVCKRTVFHISIEKWKIYNLNVTNKVDIAVNEKGKITINKYNIKLDLISINCTFIELNGFINLIFF